MEMASQPLMSEAHNVYALLEAQATYEGMASHSSGRRPFILTRAGYAGIQRYAAVWTGDVVSNWEGLRGSLPMLLNMGLSGLSFVGSDVGGYSGNATPELYARWMGLGAVSPFLRAHVTSGVPGQEPWEFGTEVRDISRAMIRERYRLLAYWYSLFDRTATSGEPMLRPLVHDFQSDPAVHALDDQAMLGPYIMVAPILDEAATGRSVYLPKGRWFEYHSGAIFEGPRFVDISATLAGLPMYVHEGAILPRDLAREHTEDSAMEALFLDLYPSEQPSEFTLYEDAGDGLDYQESDTFSRVRYQLQKLEDGAMLRVGARKGLHTPPARGLELRLHRVDGSVERVERSGQIMPHYKGRRELELAGEGWYLDSADRSIVVIMEDRDDMELRFHYDPVVSEARPLVPVTVEMKVPEGTPQDAPVYIATSAND